MMLFWFVIMLLVLLALVNKVWKAYLDPLKRKVYSLDREMGEVKTDISAMKIDINNIKNKIECLPRLEADMALVKEKILAR